MKARGRSALAKLSVPLVWRYGRDLTEDAKRGRLDPVIGREEEFTRLIQILGRKTKNNPVLRFDLFRALPVASGLVRPGARCTGTVR